MLGAMPGKTSIQREALSLPAPERLALIAELWDSLAPEDVPVPAWQTDLIRNRLAKLDRLDPRARSRPWDVVRKEVFSNGK